MSTTLFYPTKNLTRCPFFPSSIFLRQGCSKILLHDFLHLRIEHRGSPEPFISAPLMLVSSIAGEELLRLEIKDLPEGGDGAIGFLGGLGEKPGFVAVLLFGRGLVCVL